MEPSQRNEFFTELNSSLDSFPEAFSRCKILPQLINAFEFGGAGSAVLAPLFRLGRLLDEAEYQRKIVPCVVKLFSSTDRATRLNLLKQVKYKWWSLPPYLPPSTHTHTHTHTHSLTPSLPHSLIASLTHCLTHSLIASLTHSLPHCITHTCLFLIYSWNIS